MGVFHLFKIVQIVPNRAKHHISLLTTFPSGNTFKVNNKRTMVMIQIMSIRAIVKSDDKDLIAMSIDTRFIIYLTILAEF